MADSFPINPHRLDRRHWACFLPDLLTMPPIYSYRARANIAERPYPETGALLAGWSLKAIWEAKAAAARCNV